MLSNWIFDGTLEFICPELKKKQFATRSTHACENFLYLYTLYTSLRGLSRNKFLHRKETATSDR